MEKEEIWILGEFYPKVINDIEVKSIPIFEWVLTSVPKYKVNYVLGINDSLRKVFGNFIYPEREVIISRLILEEYNNGIISYFPWIIKFAHPNVIQFINDASKIVGRQKQKNR